LNVRETILGQIQSVAANQGKTVAPLTDELPLLESGLDSLCIAIIVAVLDDKLGIDPFSGATEAPFPVTLGDFIALYEAASV
jgi:hypothetical protein